MKLKPGSGHV